MNWTKTPPTKPGAYWWRINRDDPSPDLVHAYPCGRSLVFASLISSGDDRTVHIGGEWCGPLVPADEVEKAFKEGLQTRIDYDGGSLEQLYEASRARRVVEGEES